MPCFKNPVALRCVRWLLQATSPTHLPASHPVKDDLAAAADEIERMANALTALRDDPHTPPWVQTLASGALGEAL